MTRASDDDRERTLRHLRRAFTAGRLDAHELEERAGAAARARDRAELRALTIDLPRDPRAAGMRMAARADRLALRMHTGAFATTNGALVGVWAVTGAGAFWPAVVLVPWGALFGGHVWASRSVRRALGTPHRQRRLTD
jgi:hypothetical protein